MFLPYQKSPRPATLVNIRLGLEGTSNEMKFKCYLINEQDEIIYESEELTQVVFLIYW